MVLSTFVGDAVDSIYIFYVSLSLVDLVNLCGVVMLIRLIRTRGSNRAHCIYRCFMCDIIAYSSRDEMGTNQHLVVSITMCVDVPKWSDGIRLLCAIGNRKTQALMDSIRSGAAWLLGFAAAIKVYPIVFILIPLLGRRLSWVLHCVLSHDDCWYIGAVVLAGIRCFAILVCDAAWTTNRFGYGNHRRWSSHGSALHRWFVSGEFIGGSASGAWSEQCFSMLHGYQTNNDDGSSGFLFKTMLSLRTKQV